MKYVLDKDAQQEQNQITKEKYLKEKHQISSENRLLKQENQKLIKENDQIISENDLLKRENQRLAREKDRISSENKSLQHEIHNLNQAKDRISNENILLKQENQKLSRNLTDNKNSIIDFISSIDFDLHQNLLEDLNKLNKIIEQTGQTQLKEIRNLQLAEESCLSDKYISVDYICSVCLEFVENPVCCSSCEILNCKQCINFNLPCPNCRNDYREAQIPRIVRNNLLRLNFICPLRCSKEFMYEFKERHFAECVNWDRSKSKCSLCGSTLKEDLTEHYKTCEKLKIKCLYCSVEINKFEYEEHLKECKGYTKPCHLCKTGFPGRFEKAHCEFYCNKIVALKKQIEGFIQYN